MNEKPEYIIFADDNEICAADRLNDRAAKGYELVTQSSAAIPGKTGGCYWTIYTMRLRPEARDDRTTLADQVTALAALVKDLQSEHGKLVADVRDLEETLEADQANHAQHHTVWDNSIQHRLNALGKVANKLTARTAISSQLCVACAGTGRQVVGKSDQGPITVGCSDCDGTGRAPGHE